jgi:hypothetical protein
MRFSILFGALLIARAICPTYTEDMDSWTSFALAAILILFLFADVADFIRALR